MERVLNTSRYPVAMRGQRRWRTTVTLFVLSGAVGFYGVGSGKAATPSSSAGAISLKTLVVQRSDVAKSLTLDSAVDVSTAKAAKDAGLSLATMQRWGRVAGYDATYTRHSLSFKGVVFLDSRVTSFKTASGAHADYAQGLGKLMSQKSPSGSGITFHILSAPGLKDEGVAFLFYQPVNGVNVAYYSVVFRRGGYLGSLIIGGQKGTVSLNDALHYSGIMQGRVSKVA